ncbi:MAG: hypothetical protein P4L51_30285 [Puia sp.]|nr:hypothetical protein [Puia sp.]
MADVSTNKINLSPTIILGLIGSLVGLLFFDNSVYLVCCVATFYAIIIILWKSARPAVLVFALLLQWVQVMAYVIWMNVNGADIGLLSKHAGIAVCMSCLGLFIMALTLSWRLKSLAMPSREQLFAQAKLINEKKVLILYLFSTFFLGGLGFAFGGGGGFTQILMTCASIKWVFFMVYGFVAWINKKNRVTLMIIVLFEFTTSLYSYFSSFKEVIFFAIILSLTFVRTVSFKQLVYGILVAGALLLLMLTWTAIKGEYRSFLNQGKKQQVVEVSRSEAFSKIQEKVSSLTWDDYVNVMNVFLYRVQYILHLAKTMDRVPEVLPYEYGKVWWENITYVLQPRLFFPDKPVFEATIKTNKYTGYAYSGLKQGSSFSLGYFADSFIDFGYIGMFIPLIGIAFFVAFIYRSLYGFRQINVLIRYAIINVAIIDFAAFEVDGLFLFGRLMLFFLFFWFLSKYVITRLQTWLYKPS